MRKSISRFLFQNIRYYSSNTAEVTPPHLGKGSKDVPLQEGKLRLYSMRFCPYAQRVHFMLYAKDIPHDVVNINLRDKPEWFLKKFPAGKVPSLHVDGEFIYESLIVSDYLDEKYPQRPMHSKDPLRKAQDRLIIDEFPKLRRLFLKFCFAKQQKADGLPFEPVELSLIEDNTDYFEYELCKRGTKFYSGNEPGMVDYMIWPWFERLDLEEVLPTKDRFEKMLQWYKDMLADPIVKKHFCDLDTHRIYVKQFVAGYADYDNILPKSRA